MTDLFDIIYSDHPKSAIFFLFFVVVNLILWGWNKKHPNRKGENDALKKTTTFLSYCCWSHLLYSGWYFCSRLFQE